METESFYGEDGGVLRWDFTVTVRTAEESETWGGSRPVFAGR